MGIPEEKNEEIVPEAAESQELSEQLFPITLTQRIFNFHLLTSVGFPALIVFNFRLSKEPFDPFILASWPFLLFGALIYSSIYFYMKDTRLLSSKNLEAFAWAPFKPLELVFNFILKPIFKLLWPVYYKHLHPTVSGLGKLTLGLIQIAGVFLIIGIVAGIAFFFFRSIAALPVSVLLTIIIFMLFMQDRR